MDDDDDKERLLPDDYPVFATYFYLADGKLIRSPATGTVADLKAELDAKEIRRCSAGRFVRQSG